MPGMWMMRVNADDLAPPAEVQDGAVEINGILPAGVGDGQPSRQADNRWHELPGDCRWGFQSQSEPHQRPYATSNLPDCSLSWSMAMAMDSFGTSRCPRFPLPTRLHGLPRQRRVTEHS